MPSCSGWDGPTGNGAGTLGVADTHAGRHWRCGTATDDAFPASCPPTRSIGEIRHGSRVPPVPRLGARPRLTGPGRPAYRAAMDDRQRPSRRTAPLPDPASTLLEPRDAPPDAEDPPPEPETSEALSRAAREAVRQPPDPRLERSFAHLGTGADAPPATPARLARPRSQASLEADAAVIREEIAAWRTSAERLGRQLEIVTWVLIAVAAIFALLSLIILVRGAG